MELVTALHGQPRLHRGMPHEPQMLAKLYDYVMHEEDPALPRVPSARAHRPGGDALPSPTEWRASAGPETPPRCIALQRRWRRDIEAHTHFDEIYDLWESDNQKGNGYPAWPRAPLLADS